MTTLIPTLPILAEIVDERINQDRKFGDQSHRPPTEWLAILAEEFGEVSYEVVETMTLPEPAFDDAIDGMNQKRLDEHRANLRRELVQVAAVAVAMIQTGDRMNWWPTPTNGD